MSRLTTHDGKERVQVDIPEGSRVDLPSPNWCDQTTWYHSSERVVNEVLTDSGDHTTYSSTRTCWIDTFHGKITGERSLRETYVAVIVVDGVEKIENSPSVLDGDYSID